MPRPNQLLVMWSHAHLLHGQRRCHFKRSYAIKSCPERRETTQAKGAWRQLVFKRTAVKLGLNWQAFACDEFWGLSEWARIYCKPFASDLNILHGLSRRNLKPKGPRFSTRGAPIEFAGVWGQFGHLVPSIPFGHEV